MMTVEALLDERSHPHDAGVVDQHLDWPLGSGEGQETLETVGIGDVKMRSATTDLIGRQGGLGLVDIADPHPGTPASQLVRRRPADAASATGDADDRTAQIDHRVDSLVNSRSANQAILRISPSGIVSSARPRYRPGSSSTISSRVRFIGKVRTLGLRYSGTL